MSVIDLNETYGSTSTVTRKAPKVTATPTPKVAATEASAVTETREHVAMRYAAAVARVSLGFTFLWAFFDKLFGFGYATASEKAWINGGSPTTGFLKGVQGPFADTFHSMAGSAWADWLFMAGLLGIGLALTLGIGMRIAAVTGSLLLVFMWAASLPIKTNPFLDDHLVYAVVLGVLALMHAGDTAGLGKLWSKIPVVKRLPVLR
jgi:thiosulfate dehydrogenase [quinone] large subunit